MKAEELMIGDLLTFKGCVNDSVPIILRVDGILPDTLFVKIDDSRGDDEVGYEDIVGIALTPEILEKNGFEMLDKFCWCRSGDSVVYYYPETGELVISQAFKNVFYLPIHHVHELQHALKLCGINL